jgi:integrase
MACWPFANTVSRKLVKRTALAAGIRADLPETERGQRFSGHSLRAGLATAAEVDERYVQKQLGHASAEMTRHYQRRRDRFRVNLTKAAGPVNNRASSITGIGCRAIPFATRGGAAS